MEKLPLLDSNNQPLTTSQSEEPAPPPAYPNTPTDITASFSNLSLGRTTGKEPTADQCIAHLKLLECFHELRETVATTDGLYGIDDAIVSAVIYGSNKTLASSAHSESAYATLLTKVREKRWAIYVAQAVRRFERWWEQCIEPRDNYSRPDENATNPANWQEKLIPFSKSNLPPIGTQSRLPSSTGLTS